MNISIKSIRIQKHGPLQEFQQELGAVNLIYGLNETGKTYLVEFIIKSLFQHSREWALRDSVGDGLVEITGLKSEPVIFSPTSNRKIEDYWQEDENSLPLNMARLLVVKGGELALAGDSPGGVNRDVLKSALTSQALLDQIWESIQHTVRQSKVEHGQILGNNMGKIKEHNLMQKEINDIQALLETIEENYSQGPIRQIEIYLEAVENKLLEQTEAKRYLAYTFWQELQTLTAQKENINSEMLREQRDSISDYQRLQRDLGSLKERLEEQKEQSQYFQWLDTAIDTWEEKGLEESKSPALAWGLTSFLCLAAGIIQLILEFYLQTGLLIWLGSLLSGLGFGSILFYGIKLLRWSHRINDSREREHIREDFLNKFGRRPSGLVDLKEQKQMVQKYHLSAQTTQNLIDEKNNQINLEKQRIITGFKQLADQTFPEASWEDQVNQLRGQLEELVTKINELKLLLGRLNIPAEKYREKPAAVKYDPEKVKDLSVEKERLEGELREQKNQLETVKARACERIGADLSAPWAEVYYQLKLKRENIITNYKLLTAQIVAEIGLSEVLTCLREAEDQKITQAINSPEISNLMENLTGKYHKLDLENDQLFVYDQYSRFALQDLSTGAQEQIQLALRLGFASQVSCGTPLFLILDDAFQHSDWQRRNALVRSTLQLAQDNWQIVYLSMDEHIKDLFIKQAKPEFKEDFRLIELH